MPGNDDYSDEGIPDGLTQDGGFGERPDRQFMFDMFHQIDPPTPTTMPEKWLTKQRVSHVRLKKKSNSPRRDSSNETMCARMGAGVLLGNYRAINSTGMSMKNFHDQPVPGGKLLFLLTRLRTDEICL